ncbi:ChbG/HpnK family deacetylase [Candidatus Woesebacteria bacterium]|nr:ChbG/HpnK family deacetylase [Candidatus Woesebacteria bacterium]
MKLLIVNADDFGYTSGINRGVIEAHTKGIVTSTSLMVYGNAADEAKRLSKYPKLSVGLHFQITDKGLKDELLKRIFLPESIEKLSKEFDRQIEKFIRIMRKRPDHLDSHHHVHTHPKLKKIFKRYQKRHKIPIRSFGGINFVDDFFGWNKLRRRELKRINNDSLIKILSKLKDGTTELMCHPGFSDDELRNISSYSDEREVELKSLVDPEVRDFLNNSKIQLINWMEI